MKKYIYFLLLVTVTKSYCQPVVIQVKNPDLMQTLEDTEPLAAVHFLVQTK